eukprot:GGOE01007691.1.p1 GENE.GGOE01007691.1~~GGOE01007691.1.p1  ORF type:complete len:366 (-),score=87.69 GGOE01007691.1:775-1872(-)
MGHKYTKIAGGSPPEEACLYLGSIDWLIEDEILDEFQIQAIVSVLPYQPQCVDEVLQKHSITGADYMVYPLEDSADEYISLFEAPGVLSACHFIHSKRLEGKSVLVHCDAGVTRSPAVVVSYLMKYGIHLRAPAKMPLSEAVGLVRDLRDNLDICAFMVELQRLEKMLSSGEVLCVLSERNANMSFPRSPSSAHSWSDIQQEGDPMVDLALLRSAWNGIRQEGGQRAFGLAILQNACMLGGERMQGIFTEVDLPRLGCVMTRMLHQLVWCLDSRAMEKLVKFHHHIDLHTEDFEVFLGAILLTLEDRLHPPLAAMESWECFLCVLFNRWAAAVRQPPLHVRADEAPPPPIPNSPHLSMPPFKGGQ